MTNTTPRADGALCAECEHPECRAIGVYADAFAAGIASALASEAGYADADATAKAKRVVVSAFSDPATRFEMIRRVETAMHGGDVDALETAPLPVQLDAVEDGVRLLAHADDCDCDGRFDSVEVTVDDGVTTQDALQVLAREVADAYAALSRVARIVSTPGKLPVLLKRDLTDAVGDYMRLGER